MTTTPDRAGLRFHICEGESIPSTVLLSCRPHAATCRKDSTSLSQVTTRFQLGTVGDATILPPAGVGIGHRVLDRLHPRRQRDPAEVVLPTDFACERSGRRLAKRF